MHEDDPLGLWMSRSSCLFEPGPAFTDFLTCLPIFSFVCGICPAALWALWPFLWMVQEVINTWEMVGRSWLPFEKGLDPLAWRDGKVVSWSQIVQSGRKGLDPGWGKLKSHPVRGYWSSSVGIYVPTNIWYLKSASEWTPIEVYKAQARTWLWPTTRLFQHRFDFCGAYQFICLDISGQGDIFMMVVLTDWAIWSSFLQSPGTTLYPS